LYKYIALNATIEAAHAKVTTALDVKGLIFQIRPLIFVPGCVSGSKKAIGEVLIILSMTYSLSLCFDTKTLSPL